VKVAIIGTAPSSRGLAPYYDESVEIWACSPYYDASNSTFCDLPRINRFYELHKFCEPSLLSKLDEAGAKVDEYVRWLNSLQAKGATVFTQENVAGLERFPIDEITEEFGTYFTNTISFMIAHAILDGATEIQVYGVDMAASEEYGSQRPSCEYILGIARGRGIKIEIPLVSDLLKARVMYAYGQDDAYAAKMAARKAELAARVQQAKHELEMHGRAIAGATAAANELEQAKHLMNGELTESLSEAINSRQSLLQSQAEKAQSEWAISREKLIALSGAEEDTKYWEQWK
tara:strand:- start:2725 stop:3591 length:867 start_codon:yes stop_codon:yes gene_type:complete